MVDELRQIILGGGTVSPATLAAAAPAVPLLATSASDSRSGAMLGAGLSAFGASSLSTFPASPSKNRKASQPRKLSSSSQISGPGTGASAASMPGATSEASMMSTTASFLPAGLLGEDSMMSEAFLAQVREPCCCCLGTVGCREIRCFHLGWRSHKWSKDTGRLLVPPPPPPRPSPFLFLFVTSTWFVHWA